MRFSSNSLDIFKRLVVLLGNRVRGCKNQNDAVFFWIRLLQKLVKFVHQSSAVVEQMPILAGQRCNDLVAFRFNALAFIPKTSCF